MQESINSDILIVHLHNKNSVYHLTRHTLLETMIFGMNFFYQILTDDFNERYGTFSYLSNPIRGEANLYLNVDQESLDLMIEYITTFKLPEIKSISILNKIIELSNLFNLDLLKSELDNLRENILNKEIKRIALNITLILNYYKYQIPDNLEELIKIKIN